MSSTTVIKNGEANTNSGFKRLVFSQTLKLRPVVYAVHSGHMPNRGTFQTFPEHSDYVIYASWTKSSYYINVYQNNLSGSTLNYNIPIDNSALIMDRLEELHPWITTWMQRQARGGIWIPFDVVPLDKYLSYVNKRYQYESFVRIYGIDLSWDIWATSSKEGIKMRAEPNLGDWIGRVPVCRKGPNINTEELFYGSDGDGTATLLPSEPTVITITNTEPKANVDSNFITPLSTKTKAIIGTPIILPRNYRYIVRVIKGGYIRNDESYGISVEIRRNRNVYSTIPA